jgi:hypothetical protein
MPLRVNVAATARLIVSPSNVRVSARRWMSKKSFIRLFASASRTIASVFSAIEVSGPSRFT